MLSSHLAWISDAYRPTLVQEENVLKQLGAFGQLEDNGRENGNQRVTQISDVSHAGKRSRVHSAPVSSSRLQHTCREHQRFSALNGGGSKTGSAEAPRRPASAHCVSTTKPKHRQLSGRSGKEASNFQAFFPQPGGAPRPRSGHTRPLGRPRTAWGAQKIDVWHPLGRLRVLSPDCGHPPPSPADSGCSLETSTNSWDEHAHRGADESIKNVPPIVVQESDSPHSSECQTPSNEHATPWLEDPRVGLSIGFESDPRILYFDRHTRCYGKGVDDHTSSKRRPLEQWGSSSSLSSAGHWLAPRLRPASGRSDPGKYKSKVQRYVDCHRPQTAPVTRKDLQGLAVTNQHEYLPHYCSFVRGIPLQGRGRLDNEADDGYNTNSEQSPTEADLQSRRLRALQGTRSGQQDNNGGRKQDVTNSPASVVSPGNGVLQGSRQPVKIPTQNADSDVMESARPKMEETIDLVELLTKSKVRDTKDLSRTPLASAKTRKACPKKGRTPGKMRKRRGRKKGSKEAEAVEKEEAALLEGFGDQGVLALDVITGLSVDIQVPGLPDFDINQQVHTKGNRVKANKTPISGPVVPDKTVAPAVLDEPTYNFYDFGDLAATTAAMEENNTPPKVVAASTSVNDRMVLSLQSSRFELPMDMRKLEKLTPQDYLRKYCVITTRRRSLYQKMFQKHKGKSAYIQGKVQLCEALKDVLVNTITSIQAEELCDLLEVDDDTCVDFDLFSGMAALAERILYPEFLTEATVGQVDYQKEKVECADFSALEWKLHGVKVSQHVRKILTSL